MGRITKTHGVRGDVLVLLTTERTERLDPGSVLHTDRGDAHRRAVVARTRTGGSCTSTGIDVREEADALARRRPAGRADRRRRRRRAVGARARSAPPVVARRRHRGRHGHRGAGQPGRRPARARHRRARAGRVRHRPRRRHASPSTRPTGCSTSDAHRRVHDLPVDGRGVRRRRACSARRRSAGVLDVRVHDLRAAATDPHRSVDDAPFGGGAGMVLMAEPVFAAVERGRAAPPAALPQPGRPPPRPGLGPRAGRLGRASACCAAATRASTSGCASTSSTASCRSATTCSAGERWRRWSCSRRSAGWCPA